MDPISLVVSALVAGAAASVKDTSGQAIKDTYQGLKSLLLRKFADKPKAQAVLMEHEEDPETYEKPLIKALSNEHIEQDQEILEAASKIMTLVQPQQMGTSKYNIQLTGKTEGQVIGEHNQITQHFKNLSLLS